MAIACVWSDWTNRLFSNAAIIYAETALFNNCPIHHFALKIEANWLWYKNQMVNQLRVVFCILQIFILRLPCTKLYRLYLHEMRFGGGHFVTKITKNNFRIDFFARYSHISWNKSVKNYPLHETCALHYHEMSGVAK